MGRLPEHSRIACFGNGQALAPPRAKVHISSADWVLRNINRRIEYLVPIEKPTGKEQIMNQILRADLKDNQQSLILHPEGICKPVKTKDEL